VPPAAKPAGRFDPVSKPTYHEEGYLPGCAGWFCPQRQPTAKVCRKSGSLTAETGGFPPIPVIFGARNAWKAKILSPTDTLENNPQPEVTETPVGQIRRS